MKKRISLLLAIVTVLALTVLAVSFSASAAEDFDPAAPATEGAYAEIYDASGNVVATLTDITSGVNTFFAKTKSYDNCSVHIWQEFTMPGEEEIQIFGNTLVDGNGYKITSNRKSGEAAVRVYSDESNGGSWGNKDVFEGTIDTVRFKNFNLEVTNAHGFMFYNSAVLQLEAGCNVVIKSTGKIAHSARNGGKIRILGGEYTFAAKDPLNFTSTIKSGDVTYDAWADWEILGGTFRFNGVVTDGSNPWTRIFTIGNGNRNSLTFKGATIVKDDAATGHAAVIGIESSATTEGRVTLENMRFENLHWGAYVNGTNNKMTVKGTIVGLNTGTVVNCRTGTIIADGATVSTETSGKITVDVGNSGTGTFIAKNSCDIKDTLFVRVGSATINNCTIAAIDQKANTTLTVENSTVTGVLASVGTVTVKGSNLYQLNTSVSATIENSHISRGASNALCVTGGTVTMTGGSITCTGAGAPVAIDGGGQVSLTNVTVTAASRAAAEVRSENASFTAKGCTITIGSVDSGAINLTAKNTSAIIENTVITANGGRCVQLSGEGASFTMISGILKVISGGRHVIYSTGIKTATTVYDGYIINEGTSQAYGASPKSNSTTDGGDYANLTVYGGHFIVLATNGCTNTYNYATVDGFNNGSYFYGGQVYNFQSQADKTYCFGAAQSVKKSDCAQITNTTTGTTLVNSLHNGITVYKNKTQLSMREGAQVRIATDGTNGIRFISDIPKGTLDDVAKVADEGSITYGTAIVPTHYLTDNGLKAFSITALENLGVKVLKIPGTEKGTTVHADGSLTLSAAVIGMTPAQLNLAYSAMPYIEYTVGGHTVYMCGVYDYVKNNRTIADVAEAGLVDVYAEAGTYDDEYYGTPVDINGTIYYSCYSETAYNQLRTYAALDGTADDYAGLAAAVAGIDDAANVASILG